MKRYYGSVEIKLPIEEKKKKIKTSKRTKDFAVEEKFPNAEVSIQMKI